MNYFYKYLWILTIIINILRPVLVQFAVPIFPPAPPVMFPVPVPLLPMAVQLPNDWDDEPSTTTTTTTTTTQRPNDQVAFAFPFPVPMPMPMPIPIPQPILPSVLPLFCQKPPPRPQNCPPCPPCVCKPSCTPSFFSFCSPCHQKCRCKRQEDSPRPLPAPGPPYAIQIGPPPVVVVPLPPGLPKRLQKKQKPRYSSCSADSSDTSSEEYDLRSGKSKKRRKLNLYRRSLTSHESENELVKPMLSYVARNGEIKFETNIDGRDVAQLLGEKPKRGKTVHIVTRGDEENKRDVVLLSKNEHKRNHRLNNKKVYLRGGVAKHIPEDGEKELIFKSSGNKKISNLSLTFQIS